MPRGRVVSQVCILHRIFLMVTIQLLYAVIIFAHMSELSGIHLCGDSSIINRSWPHVLSLSRASYIPLNAVSFIVGRRGITLGKEELIKEGRGPPQQASCWWTSLEWRGVSTDIGGPQPHHVRPSTQPLCTCMGPLLAPKIKGSKCPSSSLAPRAQLLY